jgi:uncharacterized protein YbjT (DUF2867 family)
MFLVTGATGNVGAEVVRALVAAAQEVRALARSDKPSGLPAGVEAVAGDLNRPTSLAEALAGVRGVFLLPGYEDMEGVLAEVRGAGVERVVLLSGSSAGSGDTSNAVSAYMIRSEAAVRESGVPFTILRPFAFMSNALRWRDQLRAGDVVREPFADVAVAVLDPADIGAVAATALLADGHEGAIHVLSGPQALRPADRVDILGAALGRELRLEALSDDEARAQMSAQMPIEYVDAFFDFYVDGSLDESRVQPTVREVLGREPRTFEQWAAAHADAFR